MKLPLLNILRTSKVFAIVLGLHLFVLSLLLFHPGCQKSPETPSVDAGASAPMGAVSSLDNATLAEPTRPAGSDTTAGTAVNDASATPVIDSSVAASAPLPPAPEQTYTVAKGDSLWSIARKNGVSISALLDANGLSRNSVLKVGQSLKIPAGAASSSSVASGTETPATAKVAAGGTYKVKAGDSLGKIAKAHGVSVRALKAANHLHSDTVRVGQKLKIPGSKHAAEPAKSEVKAEEKAAPSTESSAPAAETSAPAATDDSASSAPEAGTATHKVEAGESPAIIAKKYGMKTSELMALNNISDPRKLRVGQELKVKASAAATEVPAATSSESAAKPMSVEALEAATSQNADASAPVVEVKSTDVKTASTLSK